MKGAAERRQQFHSTQPKTKEKLLFLFRSFMNGIKIYYNSNLRPLKYLNNAESAIV